MKKIFHLLLLIVMPFLTYSQELAVTEQSGIESEISIAVNPNNSDEIIIASMGSDSPIIIYTSSNGGDSWSQTSFGNGIADPVLTYGDNNTAYLTFLDFGTTLEMHLAESTDNGLTWNTEALTLDGQAADRQWIKRDNSINSDYYGNIYLSYFHPQGVTDIHIVKVDEAGNVGDNHPIHSTPYNYVQNPAMDLNSSGDIVICFIAEDTGGNRKIIAVNSVDGSETFSAETIVTDLYMFNSSGDPVVDVVGFAPGPSSRLGNSLQMAIDKSSGQYSGRVYLSWTDFVESNPNEGMNVYLSYSDDNGLSWSTPMTVNDDNVPSSHQYYAGIDVNSTGILSISWYDRRTDPTDDALTDFYFTYSSDGGENFKTSTRVNTISSDHTAVTDGLATFGVGEYTSLASTENEVYLVWSDGRENDGDMDVYFAKVNLEDVNSITEIKLEPSLVIDNLFPNPVKNGKTQLVINSIHTGEIEISLMDVDGKSVKNENSTINVIGENVLDLDLSKIPQGNYVIKIKHSSGFASKKITVIK